MTVARVAIQCTAPTGEIGDLIFTGDSPSSGTLHSPIFGSLADLYPWLNKNGWTALPYNRAAPTGEYEKA